MLPKIKWKVSPDYKSWVYARNWPSAYYKNGDIAAQISCAVPYIPCNAKSGDHPELLILFADCGGPTNIFQWRRLPKRAKTLAEAKQIFADFLKENYRTISPKEYRGMTDGIE